MYKYSNNFPRSVFPLHKQLFHIPHPVPLIKTNQRNKILFVASKSQIHKVSNYKLVVVIKESNFLVLINCN